MYQQLNQRNYNNNEQEIFSDSDMVVNNFTPQLENDRALELQRKSRSRLLSCIVETDSSSDNSASNDYESDHVISLLKKYSNNNDKAADLIETLDEAKIDEIPLLEHISKANEQIKTSYYTGTVNAPVYKTHPNFNTSGYSGNKNRDSLIILGDSNKDMIQSCYGVSFENTASFHNVDFDEIEIVSSENIGASHENDHTGQNLESFMTNLEDDVIENVCSSCKQEFDNQKKRRLIDACGHERCYTCMFRDENCPICETIQNLNDYDTGNGSSSTIVSPFGSPEPKLKSSNIRASNRIGMLPELNDSEQQSGRETKGYLMGLSSTPQPKRKLFSAKNKISGHRRAASNGNVRFANDSGEKNLLETSTCSDSVVTRRRKNIIKNKLIASSGVASHRLSLIGTNAGHLSSFVFGKIKSLWNAQSHSINAGLNQLADAKDESIQGKLTLFSDDGNLVHDSISRNAGYQNSNSGGSASSSSNIKLCQTSTEKISEENINVEPRKIILNRRGIIGLKAKEHFDLRKNTPIKNISLLNLKPLFFEVPQESEPVFMGRQWIFRELSNLLTSDTSSQGVLIQGKSGTGKTSIILQLVEYSCFGRAKNLFSSDTDGIYCQINVGHERIKSLANSVVAYHFCQIENNITCLVPEFIHSVAAQMCQAPQFSAYREYLENEPCLQNILTIKECIADPNRVILTAIIEPLIYLKNCGKITSKLSIILVDGLCEAEYHRPDHSHTIGSFIGQISKYLPSWLKIVATCRTELKEYIHGLSFTSLILDSTDVVGTDQNDNVQKDMLDYILYRINQNSDIQSNIGFCRDNSIAQYKFVNYLISLTKGSYLYCKLLMDLIEKSHIVVKSSSYKILPVSLAQIYLLNMNLKFPTTASFEKVSPILCVCLAALFPLTLKEIYYSVCSMQISEYLSLSEFISRLQMLKGFIVKRLDNTYMFFHPSFREWLLRRDESDSMKFLCDYRMGHAAISFSLSRNPSLNDEKTLELCHHVLKAHLFRNNGNAISARDLSAFWIASSSDELSAALGSLRNIYSPNIKVSRLLLLAGANPNHLTEFMGSAPILCIAAHEGVLPMVSLLIEFEANVHLVNSQGCSALHFAALRGHCDIIRLLVTAGSYIGCLDLTSRCAMVHAARMGHSNVVKYLLACDWGDKISIEQSSNRVTLEVATLQSIVASALHDHVSIVEDLLDFDFVDVNQIDNLTGETALSAASKNGCLEVVGLLLTRGAEINVKNKQGCTALTTAIKEGRISIVETLLKNSANVEETENGKSPLQIATAEGDLKIVKILLEFGADIEKEDSEGLIALSWACLRGKLDIVRFLLHHENLVSNIFKEDKNGRSLLDLAVYQGSTTLIEFLLDNGLKLDHFDRLGMRPIDRAIACRNIPVIQLMLKKGTKLGSATWHIAYTKVEIFIILINKLLEDGNVLYRKNRFKDSAHRYEYALAKLSNKEFKFEKHNVFNQLKVNLLLNLSRSKRKMNALSTAIELATKAIEITPERYEGYYARAKAKYEMNFLNEALADTKKSLERSSNAPVDVRNVLEKLYNEILSKNLTDNLNISSNEITDL